MGSRCSSINHDRPTLRTERHPHIDAIVLPAIDDRADSTDIDSILSRIEISEGVGGRSTFRIEAKMFPADSEQRADWGGRRRQGDHFWQMNGKSPNRSLTPLHGQYDGSSLRIHREMHDDGVVGPLGNAGEMSAKRYLVTN